MFRRMRHLQKRGGIWWIRKPLPRHLWSVLGKREFLVSLKTGDLRIAEARAVALMPQIAAKIRDAERNGTNIALGGSALSSRHDDIEALDTYLTTRLDWD